ncbi:MAG: TetR/AcrR family transcriptional regulator [Pelagibaca sp.]
MNRNSTNESQRRMAPDARREAILDAAQGLFMARGWEAVTIADVLEAARISKGGFYHHFTAKEDLLTGIVARMTGQAIAATEEARNCATGDALTRLNAFLASSQRWKAEHASEMRAFVDVLMRPGNDTLYQRAFNATADAIVPILEEMISDGVEEGVFDVADPRLAAEIVIGLSQGRQAVLSDAMALAAAGDIDAGTDRLDARMRAEGLTCDRLLGLPPGSVPLSSPEDYRRMLAGLAGDDGKNAGASASAERNSARKED